MRFSTQWIVWQILACTWCSSMVAQERTWLIRDGVPRPTIVRGDNDDFAAQRLQDWLKEESGVEIDVSGMRGPDKIKDIIDGYRAKASA